MKPLKIAFTDFPCKNPTISRFLKSHFPVSEDYTSPDYVVFSVFGDSFLNYSNAIRIFFTAENVHPDFNLTDYAFGFDWMKLEDRFFRCPNYQILPEYQTICDKVKTDFGREQLANKKEFCNFIYSNQNAHPFRTELYNQLSKYKQIASAGIYLNNTGYTVGSPSLGDHATQEKIAYQKRCKFSIAIENSSTVGYTTEKIVHAFAAETIPIYWGNPEVGREFNTERFLNCHAFPDIDHIIKHIKEIDSDDERYLKIVNAPIFKNNLIPGGMKVEDVLKKFTAIFSQGCAAKRRNSHVWGKIYEENRKRDIARRPVNVTMMAKFLSYARKLMSIACRKTK